MSNNTQTYAEKSFVAGDKEVDGSPLRYAPTQTTLGTENGDEQRTLWENVMKYRKVAIITFALTSAILLHGYDAVVVGAVSGMPKFQEDFGTQIEDDGEIEWILPASWMSAWNVASPLGAMIGSLIGSWFQDRVGRRLSLALASFTSAIAVAIMYVSYLPTSIDGRRTAFFFGKMVQGGAIGAVMAATQTYMSEVLPIALKASGMAFFPVFTLLGQLTGALVIFFSLDMSKGYVTAFASQWPFSFVPIVVAYYIPESPTWYVRVGRFDKALDAQARLDPAGADTKANIDKISAEIEHEREIASKATFIQCFDSNNFRRTFIVMFVNSLESIFGIPLLAKTSYFLQILRMDADKANLVLIGGISCGLFANICSTWVVTRFARRPLALTTLSLGAVFWLMAGIANCYKGPNIIWWTSAGMILVVFFCGIGVWPVGYAVAAETSSLQLRSKTQGIGWMVNAFASSASGIALPYVFNPDAGNLKGKVTFTYFGTCVAGVIAFWFLIPEMKGRTTGEIDRMFELRLPTRAFKGWRRDNDVRHRQV